MRGGGNDILGGLGAREALSRSEPKCKLKARSPNLMHNSILYWRCKNYCLPRIGNNKSVLL